MPRIPKLFISSEQAEKELANLNSPRLTKKLKDKGFDAIPLLGGMGDKISLRWTLHNPVSNTTVPKEFPTFKSALNYAKTSKGVTVPAMKVSTPTPTVSLSEIEQSFSKTIDLIGDRGLCYLGSGIKVIKNGKEMMFLRNPWQGMEGLYPTAEEMRKKFPAYQFVVERGSID